MNRTNRLARIFLSLSAGIGVCAACAQTKETVNAADFGYSPMDSTKFLQAAIDSGARTVRLDASRGDWCIQTVHLRSDLELVIGEGACVRAVPGAFRSSGAMMFQAKGVTNVTVRGEAGASLSMCKPDYLDDTRYKWSEWRHLFGLYDSQNVTVENLSLSASGGDGVYVARCKDVRLENLLCADHDRQGVSVIGAENMLIRKCRFCCTSGTPPSCGIDFEPNASTECFVSNVIEDCEFDGNASSGATFHIPHLSAKSRPLSVSFRRCRFRGNMNYGMRFFVTWFAEKSVRGRVDVEDCIFSGNFRGGLSFASMPPDALAVSYRNCIIDNRGSVQPPIVFDNGSTEFNFGGVSFENVRVYADTTNAIAFYGMTGVGVANVAGRVDVFTPDGGQAAISLADFAAAHRPDPTVGSFKSTPVPRQKLVPLSPGATPTGNPIYCQGRQFFLQYVPGAGKWPVKFRAIAPETNGRKYPISIDISVRDKVGTDVGMFTMTEPEKDFVIDAKGPGVYSFTILSKKSMCTVESGIPGRGVRADSRVKLFAREKRDFFFMVPASCKEVRLEVKGAVASPLSLQVVDASGKVRETLDKAREGHILKIPRSRTDKDEVWRLAGCECDGRGMFDVRIGGALAVVSDSAEACFGISAQEKKKK